jgi:hypothetical protein
MLPWHVRAMTWSCKKQQDNLETYFDAQLIVRVECKQWTTTDRSNLETKVQSVDKFLAVFCSALPKCCIKTLSLDHRPNLVQTTRLSSSQEYVWLLVISYSKTLCNQSFHWNNLQATIHPFVCYYSDAAEALTELKYVGLVVITKSNTHNTVAVHLFQKVLYNC